PTRPKSAAADFVRVRLPRHPIGQVGDASRMLGSAAPGKARDCQVRGTPEKVNGAALSDEASPELLENPVGLHENPPESVRVFPIVRSVSFVLVERNGIGHLVWSLADVYPQIKRGHFLHQAAVEDRHRLRLKRQTGQPAIARQDNDPMIDEIEVDLEGSSTMRDRR